MDSFRHYSKSDLHLRFDVLGEPVFSDTVFFQESLQNRVDVVLSDGLWYTSDKLARLARADVDRVGATLKNMVEQGVLLEEYSSKRDRNMLPSYRLSYDQALDWFERKGIEPGEQLVSFNYPARFWGGATEPEHFLGAPRRNIGRFYVSMSDRAARRVAEFFRYKGVVRLVENDVWEIRGASTVEIISLLSKVFQDIPLVERQDSIQSTKRSYIMRREIAQLHPTYLELGAQFYCTYVMTNMSSSLRNVLDMKFGSDMMDANAYDEKVSKISELVLKAFGTYDETACIPMPAYINSLYQHWANNLTAEEALPLKVQKFAKDYNKAVAKIVKNDPNLRPENVQHEQVFETMAGSNWNIFQENVETYQNFRAVRSAESLYFEDSAIEKQSENLFYSPDVKEDRETSTLISLAIIDTALQTKDYKKSIQIMRGISKSEVPVGVTKQLSQRFKNVLYENLVARKGLKG